MKKTIFTIIALFSISCLFGQNNVKSSLNGVWKLYYGPYTNAPSDPEELLKDNWPSISASVPGNVEIDLQWWYQRTFQTPYYGKGERAEVVFEGLDCFGVSEIGYHGCPFRLQDYIRWYNKSDLQKGISLFNNI